MSRFWPDPDDNAFKGVALLPYPAFADARAFAAYQQAVAVVGTINSECLAIAEPSTPSTACRAHRRNLASALEILKALTAIHRWMRITNAELTTEFAVRSTFCDLAVKIGGRVKFLIEVKSVGTDLKENHVNQVIAYAAQHGTDWVLLTNGATWQAHRMKFEQPVSAELCFNIDLLDPAAKPAELLEKLHLISREAVNASMIDQFWNRRQATSRYMVAQVLLSEPSLKLVRRTLRSQFAGLQITEAEVMQLLREEVIKRDVLEGDRADHASRALRRSQRRRDKVPPASAQLTATDGVVL